MVGKQGRASGLSAQVGAWTIAAIGLFNIVGSLASGWLGNLMPKRYILSFIYFARAAAVLAFISFPVTAVLSETQLRAPENTMPSPLPLITLPRIVVRWASG